MNLIRNKAFAVVAATFGLAAVLGGSLGLVAAAPRHVKLYEGSNLVGYTGTQPIESNQFVACLDKQGWIGVYRWDNRSQAEGGQRWLHYLNNVPGYVNNPSVNGMDEIPAFAGLVVIASKDFDAVFKTRASDTCP